MKAVRAKVYYITNKKPPYAVFTDGAGKAQLKMLQSNGLVIEFSVFTKSGIDAKNKPFSVGDRIYHGTNLEEALETIFHYINEDTNQEKIIKQAQKIREKFNIEGNIPKHLRPDTDDCWQIIQWNQHLDENRKLITCRIENLIKANIQKSKKPVALVDYHGNLIVQSTTWPGLEC